MESKEIATISSNIGASCWSPTEVLAQIQAIQQLMSQGMTEGEHWGKIPGCGDKPALLKPGAEKLGLMFRLAGKYETIEVNLANGHLDVKVKCALFHIVTGNFWGEGLGSCSTMESKYRYRSGIGESTKIQVPKEYWDLKRFSKFKEAQEKLGGPGYATAKLDPITGKPDKDGVWFIVEKVDKVEHPDIADTYNTVRKMAKKRAFVDAMISATAASDIFTQDIDEMFAQPETEKKEKAQEAVVVEQKKEEKTITTDQQLEIVKLAKERGITQIALKKYLKDTFGIEGWSRIKTENYLEVYTYLDSFSAAAVGK